MTILRVILLTCVRTSGKNSKSRHKAESASWNMLNFEMRVRFADVSAGTVTSFGMKLRFSVKSFWLIVKVGL